MASGGHQHPFNCGHACLKLVQSPSLEVYWSINRLSHSSHWILHAALCGEWMSSPLLASPILPCSRNSCRNLGTFECSSACQYSLTCLAASTQTPQYRLSCFSNMALCCSARTALKPALAPPRSRYSCFRAIRDFPRDPFRSPAPWL